MSITTDESRRLLDSLPQATVAADLEGKVTYANASFLRVWGFERLEEVVGRPYVDLCEEPDVGETILDALLSNGALTTDIVGIRRDGSKFDMKVSAAVIRDASGAPLYLIGCTNDLTVQRRTEAALLASERRLSLIFNTTLDPQALLSVESDDRLVFEAVNRSYLNGLKEQFPSFTGSIVDRQWRDVVTELGFNVDLIDRIAREHERVLRGKRTIVYELKLPGKDPDRYLEVHLKPVFDADGQCSHIFWNAHDITKQKASERTVRESERRLSLIFNATSDLQALYRVEDENRLILEAANRSFKDGFQQFLPGSVDPLEGRCRASVMQAIGADPSYIEIEQIACRDAIEYGAVRMLELPLLGPRGQMLIEVRIEPVARTTERCGHILWTGRDVTFRRKAEQEIRASEEMYRLLFEQMPDGVFVLDAEDASPIKFSESWAASLGYTKKEFSSLPLRQLCTEEDYALFRAVLSEIQSDRKRRILELRFIQQNGAPRRFELHIAPIEREGNLLFQCIARDITEYSESQSQVNMLRDALAHVARVGTMGELATGLAHELNQPLGALQLYASVAKGLSERISHVELSEILQKICDQSLRAGQIIARMRAFVGRNQSIRNYCDMDQLIREVVVLLESDLRRQNANLDLHFDSSLPKVWVDGIQIQQVLVNLIRNSLESISRNPGARKISIVTASYRAHLEISVSDNGAGIEPNMLDRLFLPFASSRPDGLGLGLAICKTLVEAHGGAISGCQNPSGGATFRFTIPIVRRETLESQPTLQVQPLPQPHN